MTTEKDLFTQFFQRGFKAGQTAEKEIMANTEKENEGRLQELETVLEALANLVLSGQAPGTENKLNEPVKAWIEKRKK